MGQRAPRSAEVLDPGLHVDDGVVDLGVERLPEERPHGGMTAAGAAGPGFVDPQSRHEGHSRRSGHAVVGHDLFDGQISPGADHDGAGHRRDGLDLVEVEAEGEAEVRIGVGVDGQYSTSSLLETYGR